jgi:hypothetical protein
MNKKRFRKATKKQLCKKPNIFLIAGFAKSNSVSREEMLVTTYFSRKGFIIETSRNIPLGQGFLTNIISKIQSADAIIILLNKPRMNIAFESGIAYTCDLINEKLFLANKKINIDKNFSDLKDIHWVFYQGKSNYALPNLLRNDNRIKEWASQLKNSFNNKNRKKVLSEINKISREFAKISKADIDRRKSIRMCNEIDDFKGGLNKCI